MILVCAVVAVVVAGDHWANSGQIYRGVSVAGMEVGGKTPQQAQKMIENRTGDQIGEIRLTGPREITLTADQIGYDLKTAETVENAYQVGREGNILERLSQRAQAAFGNINVTPQIDYRPEVARTAISKVANETNRKPKSASVGLSGTSVSLSEAQSGYRVDVEATLKNVKDSVENLSGKARIAGKSLEPEISTGEARTAAEKARRALKEPAVLRAGDQRWRLSPGQIAGILSISKQGESLQVGIDGRQLRKTLPGMYKQLEQKPEDADFKFKDGKVSVVPAQTGSKVDQQKLVGALEAGLFEGKNSFKVQKK